jgi:hypothetical protein
MTTRDYLRQMLTERQGFPKGSPDFNYRTRAARNYVWIIKGVPACEWLAREAAFEVMA